MTQTQMVMGIKASAISRELGRSASTLSRKLRRNAWISRRRLVGQGGLPQPGDIVPRSPISEPAIALSRRVWSAAQVLRRIMLLALQWFFR
jgi:hypothetical protein